MERRKVTFAGGLDLECGAKLRGVEVSYTRYGDLSPKKDNVVWVVHTLTSNAEPWEWWPQLFGRGKSVDPGRHCIVCANSLGSCYGSTGPASVDPSTQQAYGMAFPLITIRDMVRALDMLRETMEIDSILLGIGGSLGGQQLIEWAAQRPDLFENLCLVATNAKHSPWGIAFNETQRMSLEADPSLFENRDGAGSKGLEAARAAALLSYRNYEHFLRAQSDQAPKIDGFRAASYQRYQGAKLSRRFDARCYWTLTKAMDSHDLGRDRGRIEDVLASIRARSLVIGFPTDILFPSQEQRYLADHLSDARLSIVPSSYGHDATLAEGETIADLLDRFLCDVESASSRAPRGSAALEKSDDA